MPLHYQDIASLSAQMSAGRLSSETLVGHFIERHERIDRKGPALHAVIEINPDAIAIARQLDRERAGGKVRGPLHGIPVLLKDNIDTGDRMQTATGSLALVGPPAARDAPVARQLRDAGAIILGKANLSEWSNFRDFGPMMDGWSGRGGQTLNPHLREGDVSGSSSGPAVATAAGLATVAVGTETDGSILSPAQKNGVVGMRPTFGLIDNKGVIPISTSIDTPGPMTRSVRDAAVLLNAMVDRAALARSVPGGQRGTDYTSELHADALRGRRIGYAASRASDAPNFARALKVLSAKGAILIALADDELPPRPDPGTVLMKLIHDFRTGVNAYLDTRQGLQVKDIADLVRFNERHPGFLPDGTPRGQSLIVEAATQSAPAGQVEALYHRERQRIVTATDAVMCRHRLDAIAAADGAAAFPFAGYPGISVPSGMHEGMPTSLTLSGARGSDATLLSLAYAYEQASLARVAPTFAGYPPFPEE
ncbi:amidase family protein [Robbsia sp. Bb-Pol-6]|uniref:Amidase family protein n=1 Tax=Robbsia betulipollinis TaxID=2981849 RepID=A0ABT3ZP05_9BURK|nr:amidase family protein [Robbsia betulipollinis]